jgi:hypothetical protein
MRINLYEQISAHKLLTCQKSRSRTFSSPLAHPQKGVDMNEKQYSGFSNINIYVYKKKEKASKAIYKKEE